MGKGSRLGRDLVRIARSIDPLVLIAVGQMTRVSRTMVNGTEAQSMEKVSCCHLQYVQCCCIMVLYVVVRVFARCVRCVMLLGHMLVASLRVAAGPASSLGC